MPTSHRPHQVGRLSVRRCAGDAATLHNIGYPRSPRYTPQVCITTIRPREEELRKRNRSHLGVWASRRYDRECALVVSPEHPHYRGGVTPGVLRRRAGPSGGLPPPGAAPLMRDLSHIHRVGSRRERRRRIDVCTPERCAYVVTHAAPGYRSHLFAHASVSPGERRRDASMYVR